MAGDVTRGRTLIAEHGDSIRRALIAVHPDTGSGDRDDLDAILAAREERQKPAAPTERFFTLWPADVDPQGPNCVRGLDSAVELALQRIGSAAVRVTVHEGAKPTTWRARWIGEARSADLVRLMFGSDDDAAVPYPPIAIRREDLRGAGYLEREGRGELRVALKDGRGYIVAGDVEDSA